MVLRPGCHWQHDCVTVQISTPGLFASGTALASLRGSVESQGVTDQLGCVEYLQWAGTGPVTHSRSYWLQHIGARDRTVHHKCVGTGCHRLSRQVTEGMKSQLESSQVASLRSKELTGMPAVARYLLGASTNTNWH